LKKLLLIAAFALAAWPALAKDEEEEGPRAPSEQEAARILAHAREIRESKGCAEAAPAYRVVAAMGEGLEAGQHELAECLLTLTGANETETALLREEALFWLKRAAFAGNARAQRSLSFYYGSGNSAAPSTLEALKWGLVYAANGRADLYGFKELPATYLPGLKNDLSTEEIAEAETFAASFAETHLPAYKGPPRPKLKKGKRLEGGPEAGTRRRRPG
jgi:TPR repeat protein